MYSQYLDGPFRDLNGQCFTVVLDHVTSDLSEKFKYSICVEYTCAQMANSALIFYSHVIPRASPLTLLFVPFFFLIRLHSFLHIHISRYTYSTISLSYFLIPIFSAFLSCVCNSLLLFSIFLHHSNCIFISLSSLFFFLFLLLYLFLSLSAQASYLYYRFLPRFSHFPGTFSSALSFRSYMKYKYGILDRCTMEKIYHFMKVCKMHDMICV